MRLIVAGILVLFAGSALAQAPLTGTTGQLAVPQAPAAVTAPAAGNGPLRPHRQGHTLRERFDLANITHDGHLTQEQARAKMPAVARDFADIDTGHKGYVTVDEIREHRRAVRAAHRAARKAAAAKP